MRQLYVLTTLFFLLAPLPHITQAQKFNGPGSNLSNLDRLPNAQTRSISPENFTGAKDQGGRATEGTGKNVSRDLGLGWKASPSVVIKAGQTYAWHQTEPHAPSPAPPGKDDLEVR